MGRQGVTAHRHLGRLDGPRNKDPQPLGTCRAFVISLPTLCSWLKGTRAGVHRLVRGRTPARGISGLACEIAWHLKREWPRWGTRRIAGILARLGLEGSRSSIQRLLRQPPRRSAKRKRVTRPLPRAKAPRHMYVIDFTVVRSLFRKKSYLIFSSGQFKAFLKRNGIRHRWGAVGRPGAPTLDRWWKTLKEEYARGLLLYQPIASLERKLFRYAAWYNVSAPMRDSS